MDPSDKHLLVDPHERARVVGFTFILDAVEAVPPLAVVPLVVVVVLHLPHRFKHPRLCELKRKTQIHMNAEQDISIFDGSGVSSVQFKSITGAKFKRKGKVMSVDRLEHTDSNFCVKGEGNVKHADVTDVYMHTQICKHVHNISNPQAAGCDCTDGDTHTDAH